MYILAEIGLKSYKPLYLERGMLFVRRIYRGANSNHLELWQLEKNISPDEEDVFLLANGYPVELQILINIGKEDVDVVIAEGKEIGWMDEGDHTDELHDITLQELNHILKEDNGCLMIDLNENNVPVYQQEKVILRMLNT